MLCPAIQRGLPKNRPRSLVTRSGVLYQRCLTVARHPPCSLLPLDSVSSDPLNPPHLKYSNVTTELAGLSSGSWRRQGCNWATRRWLEAAPSAIFRSALRVYVHFEGCRPCSETEAFRPSELHYSWAAPSRGRPFPLARRVGLPSSQNRVKASRAVGGRKGHAGPGGTWSACCDRAKQSGRGWGRGGGGAAGESGEINIRR